MKAEITLMCTAFCARSEEYNPTVSNKTKAANLVTFIHVC